MSDRLAVAVQHLLPKLALTRLMGGLAQTEGGAATRAAIRWFIRRYGVNMSEAADLRVESYATFNAFFTRALRPGARPLAPSRFISPVDGAVSQCGSITADRMFQAKGQDYSLRALLGGSDAIAASFKDGSFATLYLSPRDYHRIHMPCTAWLTRMIHVPGTLYSVSPLTARNIPALFARNERVVCLFENSDGPFAMVLVGATIVGSMATVWHGTVNPPRPIGLREWTYAPGAVILEQGAEMGRFQLGSTVVMVFPPDTLSLNADWIEARPVRMGEPMATGKVA